MTTFIVPEGVKAINYDIWETLLKGNANFTRPRLRLIFDELGYHAVEIEDAYQAYKIANKHFNDQMDETGLDFGMDYRLEMMFGQLCIDAPRPDAATIRHLQKVTGELRLQADYMPSLIEPDLLDTLHAQKDAGLKLGILSNTGMEDGPSVRPILEKLGIWQLMDAAVFSSETGTAKPNPEIFWDLAEALGLEPYEILHVGDNPTADGGAVKAGLHFALYARRGSDQPHIATMKELDVRTNEPCLS